MKRRNFLKFAAALPFISYLKPTVPVEPVIAEVPRLGCFAYKEIYLSPEALDDIRNWAVDSIDKKTRKEIYSGGWA